MIDTDPRVTLQRACAILAGDDPDYAREINGQGFSKFDAEFGHSLAQKAADRWTPRMSAAALRMLRRYRGQLAGHGIDIEAVKLDPEPAPAPSTNYPVPARSRLYRIEADEARREWVIRFPFDRAIVDRIHAIPGRAWNRTGDKTWRVPFSEQAVEALLAFAKSNDFAMSDEATQAVTDALADVAVVVAKTEESVKASSAADADIEIPGLGGTLRPFQKAGIKYVIEHDSRVLIGDEMGLGKTIQALAVIQRELAALPLARAVVICPASLKLNWIKEAIEWLPEIVSVTTKGQWDARYARRRVEGITMLNGTARDVDFRLKDGTTVTMRTNDLRARILVINYDILDKHLTMLMRLKSEGVLRVIVADESHYMKNTKAQRTKLGQQLADDVPVRLALTGTPVMNEPKELISQLNFLGRINDFGGFHAFVRKYCAVSYVGNNATENAAGLLDLNRALRATCMVRRRKADVLKELDPKVRVPLPLELTNRAEYAHAERELIAYIHGRALADQTFRASLSGLDEATIESEMHAHANDKAERAARAEVLVRISTLKQIAARGKLAAIVEWVDDFLDTGEKLVLFVWHKEIAHTLATKFGAPMITGETPIGQRNSIVDAFQKDDKPQLLVMNMQAGGVGLTLTRASNVVMVEYGWNPATMTQAEDRCHRIGQQDSVTIWNMVGQGTIDEDILALLSQKQRMSDAAVDGIAKKEDNASILPDLIDRLMERGKGQG